MHSAHVGSCGATDNASDYGSEDSRFESWQDRVSFCARQASHPSRTMVWDRSRRRSSVSRPRFPDRLHHLSSIRASAADTTLANGSPLHRVVSHQHRWFSGRMLACHAGGPGSIPGRCSFGLFACLVVVSSDSCLFLTTTHVRRPAAPASVAQWLARSAVNRKVGGSTPPGGVTFCQSSSGTTRRTRATPGAGGRIGASGQQGQQPSLASRCGRAVTPLVRRCIVRNSDRVA